MQIYVIFPDLLPPPPSFSFKLLESYLILNAVIKMVGQIVLHKIKVLKPSFLVSKLYFDLSLPTSVFEICLCPEDFKQNQTSC